MGGGRATQISLVSGTVPPGRGLNCVYGVCMVCTVPESELIEHRQPATVVQLVRACDWVTMTTGLSRACSGHGDVTGLCMCVCVCVHMRTVHEAEWSAGPAEAAGRTPCATNTTLKWFKQRSIYNQDDEDDGDDPCSDWVAAHMDECTYCKVTLDKSVG